MRFLRYTFVADGSSDLCLTRVINWVIEESAEDSIDAYKSQVADYRTLPSPPRDLRERLERAQHFWPCDILFVHRDAENETAATRKEEIERAVRQTTIGLHVPVIPVRMTEAWMLVDAAAIRKAADNPHGRIPVEPPPRSRLEGLSDPKMALEDCLKGASELTGRKLERFCKSLARRRLRVMDHMEDFSALRDLSAFRSFEYDTREAIRNFLNAQH